MVRQYQPEIPEVQGEPKLEYFLLVFWLFFVLFEALSVALSGLQLTAIILPPLPSAGIAGVSLQRL